LSVVQSPVTKDRGGKNTHYRSEKHRPRVHPRQSLFHPGGGRKSRQGCPAKIYPGDDPIRAHRRRGRDLSGGLVIAWSVSDEATLSLRGASATKQSHMGPPRRLLRPKPCP